MKLRISILIIALVSSGMAACTEKSRQLTEAEKRELRNLVSSSEPKPQHELDIRFEDKVRLLGYDFDQPYVQNGQPFTIIWYWKVEKKVGEGWLQFTHIADAKNVSRINVDAERAIRRLHPPEEWKPGEYIRDVQTLTLPPTWNSPEIKLYLGLWNGPHRMHIVKGPNDGDNRALALSIPVKILEPEKNQPIRLEALKTSAPITVDGKLDEPAWQKTPVSPPFVETVTGGKSELNATVRVIYDDAKIYTAFEVGDTWIKSKFTRTDEHLWEQDVVEVMADPDGDGKNYFEIEASPMGVTFDTRYDLPRRPSPYGNLEWSSQATVKVQIDGKANDEEPDKGYVVEMAMPWKAFGVNGPPVATKESPAIWRMNFFVLDSAKEGQRAAAWSPPMAGDFHRPDKFGEVEFRAGLSGAPAASAPAASEKPAPQAETKAAIPPAAAKALKKAAKKP